MKSAIILVAFVSMALAINVGRGGHSGGHNGGGHSGEHSGGQSGEHGCQFGSRNCTIVSSTTTNCTGATGSNCSDATALRVTTFEYILIKSFFKQISNGIFMEA